MPAPLIFLPKDADLFGVLLTSKVICISEDPPDPFRGNHNLLQASLLLPPYESICQEIDGQLANADNIYVQYLQSKEPDMFITALLTAMFKGIPIYAYVGTDEREMRFITTLKQYFYMAFGICCGDERTAPQYNAAFDVSNLSKMYYYEMITKDEFLLMYPDNQHVNANILPRLIMDYGYPYIGKGEPSIQRYIDFFDGFKAKIKLANHPIILPICEVGAGEGNARIWNNT